MTKYANMEAYKKASTEYETIQVFKNASMQRPLKLENKDDQSLIIIQFSKKGEDISETFLMESSKAHNAFLHQIMAFTVTTIRTNQLSSNKISHLQKPQ